MTDYSDEITQLQQAVTELSQQVIQLQKLAIISLSGQTLVKFERMTAEEWVNIQMNMIPTSTKSGIRDFLQIYTGRTK